MSIEKHKKLIYVTDLKQNHNANIKKKEKRIELMRFSSIFDYL